MASRFRSFSSRRWAFSVFLAAASSICFARTRCTFPGVDIPAISASYRPTDLSMFSRMSVLPIAVSSASGAASSCSACAAKVSTLPWVTAS